MKTYGIVAALTSACAVSGASLADLVIGGLLPMSGSNAEYGQICGSGADLAITHVNASGMLKEPLQIVYEDSQGLPMPGVVGMNKLVNVEKVPYVLTGYTGVSKAVAPIAARTKTVTVNGGAVGPDLARLGEYFWNVIPLADFEVRAMAPHLVKEKNLKRVALIYVDDPMGQSVRDELKNSLAAAGGELVSSFAVPVNAQQFSGVAARVRDSQPDAVYIASYGVQQVQIAKQLRDNGVSQQLASYAAFSLPSALNLPEAQGALYTVQQVDWTRPDELTQNMYNDYKSKYGKAPNAYVVNCYNAVHTFALLAAYLQQQGKAVNGENLLTARKAMPTFEFVGATVSFESNGTVNAPIQINTIGG